MDLFTPLTWTSLTNRICNSFINVQKVPLCPPRPDDEFIFLMDGIFSLVSPLILRGRSAALGLTENCIYISHLLQQLGIYFLKRNRCIMYCFEVTGNHYDYHWAIEVLHTISTYQHTRKTQGNILCIPSWPILILYSLKMFTEIEKYKLQIFKKPVFPL